MKGLLKSFGYAAKGIAHAVLTGRNMRIHITFTVYMFSCLAFFDFFTLSRTELAVLMLTCALVISAEAFNTAIERCVDLVTKEYKPLAEKAKDAAAGAVLLAALFAVGVGIAIMGKGEYMRALFEYYRAAPLMLLPLALSLVPAAVFIFYPWNRLFKK